MRMEREEYDDGEGRGGVVYRVAGRKYWHFTPEAARERGDACPTPYPGGTCGCGCGCETQPPPIARSAADVY